MGDSLQDNFPNSINNNGVGIDSILLSTDGGGGTNAGTWGWNIGGYDPGGKGLKVFADAYGGSRHGRYVAVLQGVPGGTNESGGELTQWKVLYRNHFGNGVGNSGKQAVADAINSVYPAPAGPAEQSFEQWKEVNLLPASLSGPLQDADNDGITNLEEFFFFTDPSDGSVLATPMTQSAANTDSLFTFRRAKDIAGVDMKITSSSNLSDWTEEVPMTPENTVIIDQGGFEEVTISIPNEGESKYYRLELSEQN